MVRVKYMELWDEIKPVRKYQWMGAMTDVRAARYDGLAAYSPLSFVAGTGALAGAGICFLLLLMPVSFVRIKTFLPALVGLSLYGAIMGIWRQRDTLSARKCRLINLRMAPHSLFNYLMLPLVPIIRVALWNPKEGGQPDNFFAAIITCLGLFWIGAVFDYAWEALHNLFLGRLAGLNSDVTAERTLRMWIPREEGPQEVQLHSVVCRNSEVSVTGIFPNPAELRRKLQMLDFVKTATVIAQTTTVTEPKAD